MVHKIRMAPMVVQAVALVLVTALRLGLEELQLWVKVMMVVIHLLVVVQTLMTLLVVEVELEQLVLLEVLVVPVVLDWLLLLRVLQ